MATRLAEVEKGKWDQFDRRLNAAGLTAEMVEAVAAEGGEAHAVAMVNTLRVRLTPPAPATLVTSAGVDTSSAHAVAVTPSASSAVVVPQVPAFTRADLFVTDPETILKATRGRNDACGWGFTGTDWNLPDPPKIPDDLEHALTALVLTPYLPDLDETRGPKRRRPSFGKHDKPLSGVQRTFEEVVSWIQNVHAGAFWRWAELKSDPDHLRLLGNERHVPGLRWEAINLGANWDRVNGIAPETVRNQDTSPNTGVFVAAAIHALWAQHMDGINIPYVWAPGYECTIPGLVAWRRVPRVRRRDAGQVGVNAGHCWFRGQRWSVPSFMRGVKD